MAEETPAATAEQAPKKKGGKKKLIIIGVVVLALGGGAYFKLGMKKKPVPKTGDPMAAPATAKSLAQIAKLEDITLNLSDGHFLKLGLALQLAPKAPVADYTSGGAASRALDLAINVFGSSSYAQLVKPAQRDQAKDQLSHEVVKAYNGQVEGLYITDFVMQ
jgi:flagellar protein FliL